MDDVKTRTIGGKEFVLVPKRRYQWLTKLERDRKDSEIARKAMEAYDAGKLKTVTHEELVRRLGL